MVRNPWRQGVSSDAKRQRSMNDSNLIVECSPYFSLRQPFVPPHHPLYIHTHSSTVHLHQGSDEALVRVLTNLAAHVDMAAVGKGHVRDSGDNVPWKLCCCSTHYGSRLVNGVASPLCERSNKQVFPWGFTVARSIRIE